MLHYSVSLPALCPGGQSPRVAAPPFPWFQEVERQEGKRAKPFSVSSQGWLSTTSPKRPTCLRAQGWPFSNSVPAGTQQYCPLPGPRVLSVRAPRCHPFVVLHRPRCFPVAVPVPCLSAPDTVALPFPHFRGCLWLALRSQTVQGHLCSSALSTASLNIHTTDLFPRTAGGLGRIISQD